MVTPPEEIDRINERLFREKGDRIVDRDSYDIEFTKLFETKKLTRGQQRLRERAFKEYSDRHGTTQQRLFTDAGGKSLEKDRQRTAKVVLDDPVKFEERGAQKVDFKGLDTKFVFRSEVKIKGKKRIVFRDAKGRFTRR
ncbi:MAG: hypothetical protein GWO07_07090 [Candidatus Dadabacteria bacterium]|nr:hypothetical protein [Candidatus Dadabacteria bacterium]NIS08515.1 hypothetical protein [Candidatus Dadabacteria bacterium]NIV12556.1 hypothetical protein [Fodinibius sp.]NIY22405.1 hypothetical protein [Candidatus Dadabacteria bacterium]